MENAIRKLPITVFMAVYNGETYLQEAIESILQQTFTDFELLIINDGSTDESVNIINKYTDPRIRLLHNPENKGLLFTRSRAVDEARGKYFAILDCDDIAMPERLKIQYEFLSANKDVVLCASRAYYIGSDGNILGTSDVHPGSKNMQLLFSNILINSSIMARTDAIRSVGAYSVNDLAEDYDLAIRLAWQSRIEVLGNALVKYRVHNEGISKTSSDRMRRAELAIIKQVHERLGIRSSTHIMEVHHSFMDGTRDSYSLNDYRYLLRRLKKAIKEHRLYDSGAIGKIVFAIWFDLVMAKAGRMAFPLLFSKGLYDSSAARSRHLRKALKKSLRCLFSAQS
jgi:glycosyltransferase involved in cell wall biosynthesis